MAETFILQINYKKQELQLQAEVRIVGYTHKICVIINDIEVIFEPDEERNYRAIIQDIDLQKNLPDKALLELIIVELESNLR